METHISMIYLFIYLSIGNPLLFNSIQIFENNMFLFVTQNIFKIQEPI
jgi:hypothetical protein